MVRHWLARAIEVAPAGTVAGGYHPAALRWVSRRDYTSALTHGWRSAVRNKLVALLYESWAQIDDAVGDLTAEEATEQPEGCSSVAWTVGHVTNQLDSWIAVRFGGSRPHPVISAPAFRIGGNGAAENWPLIAAGVAEVRASVRRFLDSAPDSDFERTLPYDGSITYLRPVGLRLDYAVMRITAHHFMHVTDVEIIRARMGRPLLTNREWGMSLL